MSFHTIGKTGSVTFSWGGRPLCFSFYGLSGSLSAGWGRDFFSKYYRMARLFFDSIGCGEV